MQTDDDGTLAPILEGVPRSCSIHVRLDALSSPGES